MKTCRAILSVLLVLCIVLQLVPVTAQAASTKYVQTSKADVPLRNKVGEDNTVVDRVTAKGTVLVVKEENKNWHGPFYYTTWYLVTVAAGCTKNGQSGQYWVYAGNTTEHTHSMAAGSCSVKGCGYTKSITSKDSTTRYMQITRNGAPVRELPYNDGKVKREYNEGTLITTTGKVANYKGSIWYKVNTGGYIFEDNVKMATEKKTDVVNNSVNNGGSTEKTEDFQTYAPKPCTKHNWSVGKCVNCGKQWDLKIYTVSGTFKATGDTSVARDIPYREGKVMRTYKMGDVVQITGNAKNSAGNQWYRTAEGYWIYGVEDVSLTGMSLKVDAYTFANLNQTYQLKPVPKPGNGVIQSTEWSSSNQTVATVDQNGLVKPVGKGEATITCRVVSPEGQTYMDKAKIKVPEIATLDVWNYDENTFHDDLALTCSGYMTLAYPACNYQMQDGKMIVYNTDKHTTNPNNLTRLLKSQGMSYKIYNYNAMTHNNSPFVIAEKAVNYQGEVTPLLYVIIEGSAGRAGWEGNMLLTGDSYSAAMLDEHATFGKAADDMMKKLHAYIDSKSYANKPLVVITGHSRGAAVGNLLGQRLNEQLQAGSAKVQKVYAYNFATPNNVNVKYARPSKNLFNIVNKADLVTYIPLSNAGWNYTKHGITYTFDSTASYKKGSKFKTIMDQQLSLSTGENRNKPDYNFCFDTAAELSDYVGGKWKNVAQYYNKELFWCNDTELFEYFYDGMAQAASGGKNDLIVEHLIGTVCAYARISRFLAGNASRIIGTVASFADSHSAYTYHGAMLSKIYTRAGRSLDLMEEISLCSAEGICQEDREVLEAFFADSYSNPLKLEEAGWDLQDPATWTGVQVDAEGRVTNLDLSYLDLSGWLDVTPLTQLQTLNVDGNQISMLAVNGCQNLRELHCSSNQLPSLNVAECPKLEVLNCAFNNISILDLGTASMQNSSLRELSCFDNQIGSLDLSGATALQTMRCGNNQLTSLDISACTSLNTLFCSGNQLDRKNNQELASAVEEINLNGGTAEIGAQQYNSQFEFNTAEVEALNTFAEAALNREKLGWTADDPWNWQGVEWVLYENEYRVASIDLDGLDLEGDFNLPNAVCLETLSCANSSISTLNLSGCRNLSSVNCENAGISSLLVENCEELTTLACDGNALSQENVTSLNTSLNLNTGLVNYEKQDIIVDEDKFDPEERAILVDFLSCGTNAEELGWDWDWPGTWEGIVWTMDTEADLYRVNKIELPNLQISGTLDLSSFDYLESFDFSGSGIETVILPDCVTQIPAYAFYNSSLKEIYLNQELGNIGESAFAYCKELETVVLPDKVGRIGDQAFYGCEKLKRAVFTGDAPREIGNQIFDQTDGAFNIFYFDHAEWTGQEEILADYFSEEIKETTLLLNGELSLVTDGTYSMTNQYSGHDVDLTVVTTEPGSSAMTCVAVYDESGAMVHVQMLPLELKHWMNVIRLEDIDLQYIGETFCQLKIFLLQSEENLVPMAANLDHTLFKPEA